MNDQYFKNMFLIPSSRLKEWDYSSPGYYFITICTYKKKEYFGQIINKKIQLTIIGKIAQAFWNEIPKHFSFIKTDNYIIMPNHIHGIINISKPLPVETCHGMSLQNNKFSQPKSNSLPMIINQFKSSVKRYANKNLIPFFWQSRYYDHIIRSESSLIKIREYIRLNPYKWETDMENPTNQPVQSSS